MDNFPDNKRNDNNIDVEQVTPSTELSGPMQEKIVREYDKTSLDAAFNDSKIKTPLSAGELLEGKEQKKSKKALFIKLGAAAAGLLVAAGAVFAGVSSANNEPPKNEPVAEAPADPSAPIEGEAPVEEVPVEEAPIEEEPIVSTNENDPAITPENEAVILESLRFTADMDAQAMGEKYSSNITRWEMAGATSETFYAWLDAGLPDETLYAEEIARNNAHTYATALFGEDYASNSVVTGFIASVEQSNKSTLVGYLRTYGDKDMPNSNSLNKEPLHVEYKTLEVSVYSQSDVALDIIVTQEVVMNDENTMYAGKFDTDGRISDTYVGLIQDPNSEGNFIVSTLDIN